MVVIPGNPSASTSCAITPVSSVIPWKYSGVVADDFHLNVLPLIALILSNAFGITVIFSFRFLSDELKATMSPSHLNTGVPAPSTSNDATVTLLPPLPLPEILILPLLLVF